LLTVGGRKLKVTLAQCECIAFSGGYSSEYNGQRVTNAAQHAVPGEPQQRRCRCFGPLNGGVGRLALHRGNELAWLLSLQPRSCTLGCLRSRCVVRRAFAPRIHPRSKRQCAENALRARTASEHGSGRGTPVVSYAFVETARIAFSRSATLVDFHTTKWTDQPPSPDEQNRALVGHGPQCSWRLAGGAEWNLRYASCLTRRRLGTGVHLVGVCGHALRARNANWISFGRVQTSGLSKRADGWR
jgi:hypothetical protein